MTDQRREQPIPDPASQHTDADDTSIVPDITENPAEAERARPSDTDLSDES